MLQPDIDRFSGPVGCFGSLEVGQNVFCPALERPGHRFGLRECGRHGCAEGIDHPHLLASLDTARFPAGGIYVLIDDPASFNFNMRMGGDQGFEDVVLSVNRSAPGSSALGTL